MYYHPRRLRGLGTTVAALAANFGFVSLFNDSTLHILRVVNWIAFAGGTANTIAFFTQGSVGTPISRGIALYNQEQDMAGQVFSGTNTTAPLSGVMLSLNGAVSISSNEMPWFYIRQGWSLVVKADTVNVAMTASLWWEDLEMSQLEHYEL